MVMVTLIGESQARIGNRFYFIGPLTECKECRLKGVCFNLESGALYEVTGLRDTSHECLEHEGRARVVEVEKRPAPASVPRKAAMEGSVVTFQSPRCDRIGCEHWIHCHPIGMSDGQKLTITDVEEDIECPVGEQLSLVKLI